MTDEEVTERDEVSDGRKRPPLLPSGAIVGRFIVQEHIASGGMGSLYRARDPELDRLVALKLIRAGREDPTATERLLREAKVLAKLAHPHIVPVFEAGTFTHGVFIAMELIEGVTLREWSKGAHSIDERVALLIAAGEGLAAAHAASLIHRDFKPDNVLAGKDGRARVVDFGLARTEGTPDLNARWTAAAATMPGPDLDSGDTLALTHLGALLGTPHYMAPELLLGLGVDARTDQFAYGVTFFETLYGKLPFDGATWSEFVSSVTSGAFTFPDRPRVPRRLRAILARALDPVPARRFPSMDAMLVELKKNPSIARRPGPLLAMAVVALGLGLWALSLGAAQRELLCAANPAELKDVWDDRTRAAMTGAFEKIGGEEARASAERVGKKLDAFASEWTDMRADNCRATRIRKQQPEDVSRMRNDCLDRERTEVRSVTSMLANADAQVVKKALDIAYGLPNVSWCADLPTLRASAGLPDDPAKRAAVLAIRAKLAEAHSRELAGKLGEAQERADEAVTMARAVDHAPTAADALVADATIHGRQGDFAVEVPILTEATFLAAGAGADSIVVRAAGLLAFVTGPKLQRAAEARIWLETARAALKRLGGNEELELGVMEREASILIEVDSRPELAVPIQEKIVLSYKRRHGADPKTAIALDNLGDAYSTLGEPERARPYLEEAVQMAEAVGGTGYPVYGTSLQMLGQVELELGETERGVSSLEKAIAVFDQNKMTYWSALAYERLCASALAQGDYPLASERARVALALLREAKSPDDLLPTVNVTAALALVPTHPNDALALCDEALAAQEKAKAIDPAETYGWDALRCRAEALLALGRGAAAVAPLERSITLERRTFRGDHARAQFALARALVISHGDTGRAIDLATAARGEFAKYPYLTFELHGVDAWIADRKK